MANQIIGSIIAIGQLQNLTTKSGNSFLKRDLVISVQRFDPHTGQPLSDYENTPKFSFIGDRCKELDRFQVGQTVVVSFDLFGRSYETANKEIDYITEARPYKIELYQRGTQYNQQQQSPQQIPQSTHQSVSQLPPETTPHVAQTTQQPAPQQQGFKDPFN